MNKLANLLSFFLWIITVPLSLFPLFRIRTNFKLDLLITTLEKKSDWTEITYLSSIKDLWLSENQLLAICLVLFVLLLPAAKYCLDFLNDFNIIKIQFKHLDSIKKLVFVDIFLVSQLLLISYHLDSLTIEAQIGLFLLIASVVISYLGNLIIYKRS